MLDKQANEVKEVLRYPDLEALGYGSRVTIWALVKDGKFPQPCEIGNRPGWFKEDIETYKSTRPRIHYGKEQSLAAA